MKNTWQCEDVNEAAQSACKPGSRKREALLNVKWKVKGALIHFKWKVKGYNSDIISVVQKLPLPKRLLFGFYFFRLVTLYKL